MELIDDVLEIEHGYLRPIEVDDNVGLIAVVGEGMRGSAGLAGRIFTAVSREQVKLVTYELQPGEKKMLIGEAAYVIIDKIYTLYCKGKYGTDKMGMAKIRNPQVQEEMLKFILVGPIITNVEDKLQTYVEEEVSRIEGFTDVQTEPSGANGGNRNKNKVPQGA